MQQERTDLRFSPELAGRVVVLEAEPGHARDGLVRQWLAEGRRSGAATWLLPCACEENGLWAGLADLLEVLVPQIQDRAPQLLTKHHYELRLVLPCVRQHLPAQHPALIETVREEEKTINHPPDWASRILHGLIDLLDAWHRLGDHRAWVIACDRWDEANVLVTRFFSELMRRRGRRLQITLLALTAPGTGQAAASSFDPSVLAQSLRLKLPGAPPTPALKATMTRLALELERQIEEGAIPAETHLPRLIRYWQRSATPDKALRWQVEAMYMYNRVGLYEVSVRYGAAVEANLDRLCTEYKRPFDVVSKVLLFCYLPLGQVERAQRILTELIARAGAFEDLPNLYYLMAMQYARYLPTVDLVKAEEYLESALVMLPEAGIPERQRHFFTAFLWNALAFVRFRQGRPQEALDLCRRGIAWLDTHLDPDQHRLQRSIMLHNSAHVYARTGQHEQALAVFEAAITFDPNYANLYHDRGNYHLTMGRLDEAERDYLQAIELSPPYAGVWTNLGQCYRAMDRMADAVRAYCVALDLDPTMDLALVGRAEAYAALGQPEVARADLDAALALDPAQPLVLASRAILHYEAGRIPAALSDLDEAVALAPQTPMLYQNRAVALRQLGRFGEAAENLQAYLRLSPDAEDRAEVEHDLLALQSMAA